jgi:hypothetical protein
MHARACVKQFFDLRQRSSKQTEGTASHGAHASCREAAKAQILMRTGAGETKRGKRLSGAARGSCEIAITHVVAASSHSLPIHRLTDALN